MIFPGVWLANLLKAKRMRLIESLLRPDYLTVSGDIPACRYFLSQRLVECRYDQAIQSY